tara:strand:+ start:286 stop:417 length:132 start_codon:yes stop_codon:yes gene_type:complete
MQLLPYQVAIYKNLLSAEKFYKNHVFSLLINQLGALMQQQQHS